MTQTDPLPMVTAVGTAALPPVRTRRRAKPWQWLATVVVLLLVAMLVESVATNSRFG